MQAGTSSSLTLALPKYFRMFGRIAPLPIAEQLATVLQRSSFLKWATTTKPTFGA